MLCVDFWVDDNMSAGEEVRKSLASGAAWRRFESNVRRTPHGDKVFAHRGSTTIALARLLSEIGAAEAAAFDLIYVDAGHAARDVMADAVLSLRLLRIGGVVVFDDYGRGATVGLGVDSFLAAHPGIFELIESGYQMILRKTAPMTSM